MAISLSATHLMHSTTLSATFTADGDVDIAFPDKPIAGISFQSDGVDGGGTLTVLVSIDGLTYVAAGFNTSADPRNLTAVTSATASGAWILPEELISFRFVRFHLTGSTTPTLVLMVNIAHRN